MQKDVSLLLAENGFVILDILDKNEVDYLNQLCSQFLHPAGQDFISSSHFLNKEDSTYINQQLHLILQEKISSLFPELQLLGGTLATKRKGKNILKAHNDWSIVDETTYNSYNLWTTLVNTNKQNGTLGVIPGSHLWESDVRGFQIPNAYENFSKQFIEIGYEPELKAGQAILYNHKLVHYSRPNTTDVARNVAIIGLKDKSATLQVAIGTTNNKIEIYKTDEEDFYTFNAESIRAKNQLLLQTKMPNSTLTWKQIEAQFHQHLPNDFLYLQQTNKSWIEKIKRIFQ